MEQGEARDLNQPAAGIDSSGSCKDETLATTHSGAARRLAQARLLDEMNARELSLSLAEGLESEGQRLCAESEAALAELRDAAGRYVAAQEHFQPPDRFP